MEKLEKMKKNRAGHYIPREFAEEIDAVIKQSDCSISFQRGARTVLAYLCCREGKDMHGVGFGDYLKNARIIQAHRDRAASEAHEVISFLKALGVDVVEVEIVRGGK